MVFPGLDGECRFRTQILKRPLVLIDPDESTCFVEDRFHDGIVFMIVTEQNFYCLLYRLQDFG